MHAMLCCLNAWCGMQTRRQLARPVLGQRPSHKDGQDEGTPAARTHAVQ